MLVTPTGAKCLPTPCAVTRSSVVSPIDPDTGVSVGAAGVAVTTTGVCVASGGVSVGIAGVDVAAGGIGVVVAWAACGVADAMPTNGTEVDPGCTVGTAGVTEGAPGVVVVLAATTAGWVAVASVLPAIWSLLVSPRATSTAATN